MTKLQAIVTYLEGWLDYFPHPEVWTGSVERRSAIPGPAPSRVVECDRCDGSGRLAGGWRCEECGGAGRYAVDAYTLRPVATDESSMTALLDTWSVCSTCGGGDRQCSRCNGSGRESALLSGKVRVDADGRARPRQGDSLLDALSDGVTRRQATLSGRKIEQAMRELRDVDAFAHALIVWAFVLQGERPQTMHPWSRVKLVGGLLMLERLVPGKVVLPPELLHAHRVREAQLTAARGRQTGRSARLRRDAAIREAYATGAWSQDALARKFGVDQATISRAVRAVRDEEAA